MPLPDWMDKLVDAVSGGFESPLDRYRRDIEPIGRPAAVLMLFGQNAPNVTGDGVVPGPDILLLERAATLRNHAGQPAFPGGAVDPEDTGVEQTALREANEETGLDPSSVRVVASLPPLPVPVSRFLVTPVLAWWERPHPVAPLHREEVASVTRVPVSELVDPANRVTVRHPAGYASPGFAVRGMVVWGFTAALVSGLLDIGGWTVPWHPERVLDVPSTSSDLGLSEEER
ncbi:CoA pyrophosphatase [Fodinicola feengrottensis]